MIWGAMSCCDAAGMYFIPPNTTMYGLKYMKLHKEQLKLNMDVHGCTIFMQDGAPCHPLKVAPEFLKKTTKTSVQEWPVNGPDLNPIENIW